MKTKVTQDLSAQPKETSGAVKSVYRAIKILEAFNADEGMTVTEISKRSNFPKSSVHQILNTLTSENILKKNQLTNRYFFRGQAVYSGRQGQGESRNP